MREAYTIRNTPLKSKISSLVCSRPSRNFRPKQERNYLNYSCSTCFMLFYAIGRKQLHYCQSHLGKERMQIPFFLLPPSWLSAAQLLSPCCHAGAWLSLGNASHGPHHRAVVSAVLAASMRCQCNSALLWRNFLQPPNKVFFLTGLHLFYFQYIALHTDKGRSFSVKRKYPVVLLLDILSRSLHLQCHPSTHSRLSLLPGLSSAPFSSLLLFPSLRAF